MKGLKMALGIFLLSIILISCKNESDVNTSDNVQAEILNQKGINSDKQEIVMSDIQINEERLAISLDDISHMYIGEDFTAKNEVGKIGNKFINELKKYEGESLNDNINGGIPRVFQEKAMKKYPKELKKDINLELSIKDAKTKKTVKSGKIYVNGIIMGEFKDGEFQGTFPWLKGIEKFNITIRAPLYGDGFIVLNSLNSEGSLLVGDILLKKKKIKEVTLGKKQEISLNNTTIGLGECSLVNKVGECFTGPAKLELNHISGSEANNYSVSLNRRAVSNDGDIVELLSGGMAFIDFVGDEGEILQLKDGEKIKISYNVSQEDIASMANTLNGTGTNNGYWWYDKEASIWKEGEADYKLDEEKMTWTIETGNLY